MLGLLWIIAQIPRKNTAGAYRLHDVGSQGFTLCDPSVLAAAVENQINTLPGVVTSAALLRGTAKAPDLTLKVTVNDRADVRDLIHRIQTSTLPELSNAWTRPCSAAGCRSTSADESKAPEPLCIPPAPSSTSNWSFRATQRSCRFSSRLHRCQYTLHMPTPTEPWWTNGSFEYGTNLFWVRAGIFLRQGGIEAAGQLINGCDSLRQLQVPVITSWPRVKACCQDEFVQQIVNDLFDLVP